VLLCGGKGRSAIDADVFATGKIRRGSWLTARDVAIIYSTDPWLLTCDNAPPGKKWYDYACDPLGVLCTTPDELDPLTNRVKVALYVSLTIGTILMAALTYTFEKRGVYCPICTDMQRARWEPGWGHGVGSHHL
jgi:hypothetical protein